MRISFKPESVLGNWSIRLIIASAIFFIIFASLVATGQRGGDTFFSNLLLAITILIAAISAGLSFFIGIISVIKSGERACFVYISTLIGFIVLLYGLGEIIFPH